MRSCRERPPLVGTSTPTPIRAAAWLACPSSACRAKLTRAVQNQSQQSMDRRIALLCGPGGTAEPPWWLLHPWASWEGSHLVAVVACRAQGEGRSHTISSTLLVSVSPGSLDVCPSPCIIPPSPTLAEKELPWKGDQADLAVYVSSETTKIVPVDMQKAWNQSISSLESIASPPGIETGPQHRRFACPVLEEQPQSASQAMPEQISCFQFPSHVSKSGRSLSDSSPDGVEQQELQPLMASEEQGRALPPAEPRRLMFSRASHI